LETGLGHMGEDDDVDDEEDAMPPPPAPPATAPKEIDDEGPMEVIPEQEALVPHEVVLVDAEFEMPQLRLYHALMSDYEENPLRMDEWFPKDESNDRD
jgi:hypothetical protein